MKTNNLRLLFVLFVSLVLSQTVFSKINTSQLPDQLFDSLDPQVPKKYDSKIMLAQIESFQFAKIEDKSYQLLRDIFNRKIPPGEKKIVVDPVNHTWHAYAANGKLVRSGIATAGGRWCSDIGRSCKTKSGTFRINSLGSASCVSSKYPIERGGGAPMPYCMFFNGSQGLHGSYNVVRGNVSHGCVRLKVSDAKWLRFNFVTMGTKVIVKPY
jgi:hypothetical protein